jgi:N-acetylglucosaminyl-diphospho-decaprenol L-rhamnosyltransferase
MPDPLITVSVVSHGQNALVNPLLSDLARYCHGELKLILTENIADSSYALEIPAGTPVERIVNPTPKGFGANHNAAFARCRTELFCVANPDIRLASDPFKQLTTTLIERRAGVVGPLVRSEHGSVEDSARRYPTLASLAQKALTQDITLDYAADRGALDVDWIAGMFMLFRSETFRAVDGFDERYFLYYEDVDLCRRLRKAGWPVIYEPAASVIHAARRASRRHPRLALTHIVSAIRFLTSS